MCVLESLVVMFMDDKIVLGSAITIFKARCIGSADVVDLCLLSLLPVSFCVYSCLLVGLFILLGSGGRNKLVSHASSIAAKLDLVRHGSDLVQSFYCSLFLADFSPISQQNRLYCFEEGAEQFLLDVAQNTNDIEEFIWCNLCKAQVFGVDEAKLEETEGHS
ncbi:Tetratricopeptide repeat (TPR) superfamily protein [Trifolium repens]|nr:Tetratricopeptide repeat (TPR) superfamily protein [Trifolium repens]